MKVKRFLLLLLLFLFLFLVCLQIKFDLFSLVSNSNNSFDFKEDNRTNFNYFKPNLTDSYYIQLDNELVFGRNVTIYEVDLFDTSINSIEKLHDNQIKVICYFSAGTYENWREDSFMFPKEFLGNSLENWPDEKWLDISNYDNFSVIIEKRLDLAVNKNCDGVDPDNVDGYLNENGFNLTFNDQLRYNIWLSNQAHKRNLSIGLKNDLKQIKLLEKEFDFAVNEQCFYYNECDYYSFFIEENKPVFNIEYNLKPIEFCNESKKRNFFSIVSNSRLNGESIEFCDLN